ncbi:MAG: fatty acid metabolism transcriptional regulator FadR [Anaerolineaceae bacterium]|nr:fatty acid metabolism transcriptional regulator FadR [Anaerolineaceae bacterium]
MNWYTPLKPAEIAEQRLVQAILENVFPINSFLPPERDLSAKIGVTRPTLREALQRLARDGWLEIHQGKPTRVRDYWSEGNLSVLSSIAKYEKDISPNFIIQLLEIRVLLSPTYTQLAIQKKPKLIADYLSNRPQNNDLAEHFAKFDWELQQLLAQNSGNPIFTLILNGFEELYKQKGILYFSTHAARENSENFYKQLWQAALEKDHQLAFQIALQTMQTSIQLMKSIL